MKRADKEEGKLIKLFDYITDNHLEKIEVVLEIFKKIVCIAFFIILFVLTFLKLLTPVEAIFYMLSIYILMYLFVEISMKFFTDYNELGKEIKEIEDEMKKEEQQNESIRET